jgi:hypothetical protein
MIRLPTKSQRKNLREEDSHMLKYVLLGFGGSLYVAWTIFKAVMDWIERRREQKLWTGSERRREKKR